MKSYLKGHGIGRGGMEEEVRVSAGLKGHGVGLPLKF